MIIIFLLIRSIDPYYNQWTEHSADSVADFMGTSQYNKWNNQDGGTQFWWNSFNNKVIDYTGSETLKGRDGAHGMKLFAEANPGLYSSGEL